MFERKLIGEAVIHKGRKVEARYCGPDCLCYVDGFNIGNFYLTAMAAREAGVRYINQVEAEKKKTAEKSKKKH